jgi:hypothetical protein
MKTIVPIILALFLALAGCRGQSEPSQSPETKKTDISPVQPSKPDKRSNVCEAEIDEFPEPNQTSSTTGACQTSTGAVYMERTLDHLRNVTTLMKENMSDCGMVIIAVSKYIETNRLDIENAIKVGDEALSRMSDQERKMVTLRAQELFNPIMQEVGNVSAEFAKKCRPDVKRLSELLKSLGGQASGL